MFNSSWNLHSTAHAEKESERGRHSCTVPSHQWGHKAVVVLRSVCDPDLISMEKPEAVMAESKLRRDDGVVALTWIKRKKTATLQNFD